MKAEDQAQADSEDILRSFRATLVHLRLWGLRDVLLSGSPQPDVPVRSEENLRIESPPSLPGDIPSDARRRKETLLQDIRRDLGDCRRCPLHAGRTHLVFGEGDPAARLVFVGEGPGADEDRLGRPFVGQAGQLLNRMIRAMGFRREDVYICNVVKCRPPGNRVPAPEEIRMCSPFLIRQLEAVGPQVICTLGACASQTLLRTTAPISDLRRKIHVWRGIPLIATYHPAYLLRNSAKKAETWKDLLDVMAILNP